VIPKTAYFYWGSEVMSYLRYMTFYTFRAHNPNWKIVLVKRRNSLGAQNYEWAEQQDFMFAPLPDYSDKLDDLNIEIEYLEDEYPEIAALDISDVHTSDILAWYILGHKGGVVADTDIVFVRPFDYDRFKTTEFGICCFQRFPKPDYMPVSFMISQPNEIFRYIYKKSVECVDKTVYESAGTIVIEKSLGGFKEICDRFGDSVEITRLPSKIVFPFAEDYPWGAYSGLAFANNVFSLLHLDCIGIHWYAGAPGHQSINRRYADGNYKKFENTVSSAIAAAVEILG